MAQCALCGLVRPLKLSHTVPKFIIKYLKETSVGKIRNLKTPNRTVEDGEKYELLCSDCEARFSVCEKYFADTIFYPYKRDGVSLFHYDERLFYYLTSLAWRSLYLDCLDTNYPAVALEEMNAAENSMRLYLLREAPMTQLIENHLFFFDVVKTSTLSLGIANKPNAIIHRSIASYSIAAKDNSTIVVFSNMMGIIAVTFIKRGEYEVWDRTEIINGIGSIEAKNQSIQSIVGQEITYLLEFSSNTFFSISEKQKDAITKRIEAHSDDIQSYPVYKDWFDDISIHH